jgi:hypothetical protein
VKILRILYYKLRCADRRWALSQIDPLHPDVRKLVIEQREFADRLHEAWTS